MPVDRAEVTDAESLKQIMLLREQCFQAIVEAKDVSPAVIIDQLHFAQSAVHIIAHFIVRLAGCDIHQILAQPTDCMIYCHIVIIKNDKQIVRIGRSIIQTFERQTARHGSIADHSDHVPVLFPFQGRSDRHSHSRRNGI